MKKAYLMYCEDDNGEYELWFDESKELIGGYFCNDASWRSEYFDGILHVLGVNVKDYSYSRKIAKKACKELWGF